MIVHAGLDDCGVEESIMKHMSIQESHVKAGDVLLTFDIEEIAKAGYDVTTPIVITNLSGYKITKCLTGQQVQAEMM